MKEGVSILSEDRDISVFGKLLDEAWQAKRNLSPLVSNADVDAIYAAARAAGALGGKLLGAGGGGFLLLFVPPDHHKCVKNKLGGLIYVPCRCQFNGSQIIFFDPETEYPYEERSRERNPVRPFRELSEESGPR